MLHVLCCTLCMLFVHFMSLLYFSLIFFKLWCVFHCKTEFRVESKGRISLYGKPTSLSVTIRRFDIDSIMMS